MSENTLLELTRSIAEGDLNVIDLTHTLSANFPALILPPEFGQVGAFEQELISCYDARGPAWYWNNFSCGEHTGTHLDAPVHWVTGRDYPNNSVDTMAPERFIAPAVVVDASKEVAEDPDWLLGVEFLKSWERAQGQIEEGSWLFFRTDWHRRVGDPASFVNMREDGAHTPGPDEETVEWLIQERNVCGFGVETINTDAGQSYAWPMPYPCHTLMHGANRLGLQCLCNLDQLPPKGSVIISTPLKLLKGSGSPTRVIALVAS